MFGTESKIRTRVTRVERFLVSAPPVLLGCAVACISAAALIFFLPFRVPVQFEPVISASFVAGFNNHAAVLGAVFTSLTVCAWSWWRERLRGCDCDEADVADPGLGLALLIAAIVITVVFTALAAWALHYSGQRYLADAGYFIEQMSKYAQHDGTLYNSLEFAYGPLLFYPTVWLQEALHCSTFNAYFITLAAEQTLGLLELAWVLQTLHARTGLLRFAFVLFAIGAINPLLGLNYTLFRYLTPIVLLLMVLKVQTVGWASLMLAAGQAMSFGISAEMGVAYGVGCVTLLLWRTKHFGVKWIPVCVAPIIGAVIFGATVGRPYFQMLAAFAKGALSLPVLPYPHLLIFLFCVVWLVPLAVGRALATEGSRSQAITICYAFGLALLPSTLGRCDPLHVFFNGLLFLLLSLVSLRRPEGYRHAVWASLLGVFVIWQVGVTNRLFRFRTADTLSAVLPDSVSDRLVSMAGADTELGRHLNSNGAEYRLDIAQLEHTVGASPVATPLEITPSVEAALKNSHHFQSSYFAFMVDTFSEPAEQKAITDMNRANWALVPALYPKPFLELPGNLQDLQGFAFPLRQRHAIPFYSGAAMEANLQTNWSVAEKLGPYLLLRRNSGTPHDGAVSR